MIAAAGSEFGLEVKIPYDGRIPPKERERERKGSGTFDHLVPGRLQRKGTKVDDEEPPKNRAPKNQPRTRKEKSSGFVSTGDATKMEPT